MTDDGKMLNYIRQNVEMGVDGIDMVVDHVHGKELKDTMLRQRKEYADYFNKVDNLLKENRVEPEDLPMIAKVSSTVMTKMKNIAERTDESIAEDMIKGTNMGIIKLMGHLNDFHGSQNISSITEDLIEYEKKSIEQLEAFL